MATINIGGRTVDVPDDLDPARPAGPTLHGGGSPTPQATPSPTAAFDAEVAQRAARLRQGGMPAPAAPPTPLTPAGPPTAGGGLYKAGSAAGKATDWLTGGKPGPVNRTMGTLGRVGGLAAVGESFRDNVQGMGNVFHSPDAKVSDKLAAGVEGAGNIIGTGALSLSGKFPLIGPAISGAIGPNPASALAGITGDSVLEKFNPGKGFGSTRVGRAVDGETAVPGAQPAAATPTPAPAAAPVAQPTGIKDPYADANAAKLATGGTNAPAQPDALPPGYTNNVTRDGNSYSGMNVRGDITINGFQPGAGLGRTGPSSQNMAAADALAARDGLRSAAAVGAPQPITPVMSTDHSGNSWSARNHLRNLETSASSIMNNGGRWDQHKGASPAAQAYLDAVKTDTALRSGNDPMALASLKARADEANNIRSTDASRYSADQTLRGNVYQTAGQLAVKRQESALRQQQQMAMGQIFQMAGGDPAKAAKIAAMYGLDAKPFTDMAQADQTRQYNATTNASKRLEGMAVVKNDKGEMVISPGRLAKLNSTLGKMSPGWQHMDEPGQAAALAKAEASVNLLEGLNDRRNSGFWQAVGIDGKKPDLSTLPDMQGGRLEEVGTWEGATAGGGVGRNDYALVLGDGKHRLHLPRGAINQGELELLKERGVDISGLSK